MPSDGIQKYLGNTMILSDFSAKCWNSDVESPMFCDVFATPLTGVMKSMCQILVRGCQNERSGFMQNKKNDYFWSRDVGEFTTFSHDMVPVGSACRPLHYVMNYRCFGDLFPARHARNRGQWRFEMVGYTEENDRNGMQKHR